MTADIVIGRFGSSADVGVSTWDIDGDSIRAGGWIVNTDRTLVQMCRQQLLGLADSPDESLVPVTFASDSSQDGYYLVEGGSVGMDVGQYAAKAYPWQATLTRPPNFARPDIEVRSLGTVRPNIDSFTTGNTSTMLCLPGGTTIAGWLSSGAQNYDTANGDVVMDTNATYYDARTRYKIVPASYYNGSCSVEQKIGSTWYPVVGRQCNAAATDLRVNNGLLRIAGYTDGTASLSGITLNAFNGSTWGAVNKTFNFRRSGAALLSGGPYAAQIIRNRPEEATIRFAYQASTATVPTVLTADVRLKRGHRMADVTLYSSGISVTYVVRTGDAMTSRTGGYDATSADADSMKHVIGARSATSLTNSNLDVLWGAAFTRSVVFGVGVRLTNSDPWGSTSDTMNRWFAQTGESQTIKGA